MSKIRIQTIDSIVVINILMPLTKEHRDKLESKDYEKTINNIANDLHIDWSIEVCGDESEACISRMVGTIATNKDVDNLENDAISFMAGIEKIELRKPCNVNGLKWPCTEKNSESQLIEELKFAKEVIDNWDETEEELEVIGAELIGGTKDCPLAFPIGHVSGGMLKRMFKAFIAQNDRS